MKPDRYEWLNGEHERGANEGTGARHVSDVYAELLMRAGGLMLAMLLIIVVLQALPRTSAGTVQPPAALLTGIVLVAISSAVLYSLKPAGIVSNWAMWTTFTMGCVISAIGLL